MSRETLEPAELAVIAPVVESAPWLLVFAGTSLAGRRRGSRLANEAAQRDVAVLLFDGHPGQPEQDGTAVIAYSRLESDSIPARMARYTPAGGGAGLTRPLGKIVRRLGSLARPFWGWRLLRPVIVALAAAPPPVAIAYCDDSAIPLAWHTARMWSGVPVISELSEL